MATDENCRKWLEKPENLAMLEIATTLEGDIRVIPLLVRRAMMPLVPDLAEGLLAPARRISVEVSDGCFRDEVGELIKAL